MPWQLDRTKTKLEFSVKHMLIHTVRGRFSEFEADLDLEPENLENSSVKARVFTKSVDTGDRLRDEYLRSKFFFNPEQHPCLLFESKKVSLNGRKLSLSGRLKIRDRENSLILTGTVSPVSQGPNGARRLAFDLTGEVTRETFDLTFLGAVETVSVVVGKKVPLSLHIEAVESPAVDSAPL